MNNVSLIIPSYKPDEKLLRTLEDAVQAGFTDILLIDDGSGAEYEPIFAKAAAMEGCTLLRHPENRGKGAGLKTAMAFFLEKRPRSAGVVAADADGQHLTADILAVAKKMEETGNITLGYRDFSGDQVPWKSKFGNRLTRGIFRLFFGMKIRDTQTGLRAYPRAVLSELLTVEGERYEYETNMFFHMSRGKLPFEEVEIQTVYLEENRSSHFRAVRDSLRIYALILKYLFSSAAAAVVDALAFFLMKQFPLLGILPIPLTFTASFLARGISSLVNFLINARVVFGDRVNKRTLFRYYFLVAVQICLSALAVFLIEHLLQIRSAILSTLLKGAVDTVLFFFSFRIQHRWVFNSGSNGKEEE